MPREDEPESMVSGRQSPVSATESRQSLEPMSEFSENRESSLDPTIEEAPSSSTASTRDSAVSESISEDSVCSKCGGIKIKSDLDPPPSTDLNNDGDVTSKGTASNRESTQSGDTLPEPRLICKCAPDEETKEEANKTLQESDSGDREGEETRPEEQSLAVVGDTSIAESPDKGLETSDSSVEEISRSSTSGSVCENFAVITCIQRRPPPGAIQQRRRCGPEDIPLQDYPLLGAGEIARVEEGRGGAGPPPPAEHVSGVIARNRANQPSGSVTTGEYKSMLAVVGGIIVFVLTVVIILITAAQISLNRSRSESDANSTKSLGRNSTAGEE